jgi:predicted phage terminase large subunit-like protein
MTWQPSQGEAWRAFPDTYAAHQSRALEGQEPFNIYRHVEYMAEKITPLIVRGGARIRVSMPPQHGKSRFLSSWLPTWFMDTWPTRHVAVMGHTATLAQDFGREVLERFQRMDRVRHGAASANNFQLNEGGRMVCVGVDGGLTGRGAHLLILDDPHKDWADAHSPVKLEHLRKTYDSVASTRLRKGASVLVVHTRWQKQDLIGWLQTEKSPDGWLDIVLPAIAGADDPMGREEGEALCPDLHPLSELEAVKEDTVPAIWTGMYQQEPTVEGGNLWKGEWFQYFNQLPEGHDTAFWYLSVDCKNKKEGKCPAVVGVWLILRGTAATNDKPRFYRVDQARGWWGTSETIETIKMLTDKHPRSAGCIMVEDAAAGPSVMEALREEFGGIVPITAQGSKYSRAAGVEPVIRQKRVFLPANEPWVAEYLDEVTAFPASIFNDQVDETSQAIAEGAKRVVGLQVGALLNPRQRARHEKIQNRKRVVSPWLGGM